MFATVLLCMASCLTFCLCVRGFFAVTWAGENLPSDRQVWSRGFSSAAWRLAQGYVRIAFLVLACVSLIGTVTSFLELLAS